MVDARDPFDGLPSLEAIGRQVVDAARTDEAADAPARTGSHLLARRRLRLSLAVTLAAAALVGVAVAATQIIATGRPVPPDRLGPGLAEIVPGTTRLLSVRAADPDGGPSWGLRVFRTRQGTACVQVGRVVNGKLGVLGQDGVFANDGRFHELPVGADGCGGLDARGQLFMDGGGNTQSASGINWPRGPGVGGCETREDRAARVSGDLATLRAALRLQLRRGERAAARRQRRVIARYQARARIPIPLCPTADLRDVIWGFVGAKAQKVTLTEHGNTRTLHPSARESGAYLVVLRGTFRDHERLQRRTYYPGGITCGRGFGVHSTPGCSPPPGSARPAPTHAVPKPGVRPAPVGPPPGAHPPAPLHVAITPLRGLAIRFAAPFPGHRYEVVLICERHSMLQVREPTLLPDRRPHTVRLHSPFPSLCADTHHRFKGQVFDADTGRRVGTFQLHGNA